MKVFLIALCPFRNLFNSKKDNQEHDSLSLVNYYFFPIRHDWLQKKMLKTKTWGNSVAFSKKCTCPGVFWSASRRYDIVEL